ncbi:MAG TPA: hypothetical protein VFS22_10030 [Flavisolibacter sp.]|nr:hypothetical protein [Flavisolibacter sp.]
MDYEFHQSPLSKAILTGLFAGFTATIVCLVYNLIFRESTLFSLSDIINVSSLIFAVNLLFLVIGIIYYGFIRSFSKGNLIFITVFALLTVFFAWKAEGVHRSANEVLNTEFRQLLLGVVIIIGLSAAFLLPFLFHSKKFEEHVL